MKSSSSLVPLALLCLAVVLYLGVLNPLSATLLKTRSLLTTEESRLAGIEMSNKQRDGVKMRVAVLERENAKRRTTLLAPLLNSYSMRVKSLVDTLATESGLANVEYEEGSLLALPVPREQLPERRTARRSVRIKASADYAAAVSFLMRAEKELPLLTVQSVTIQPSKGPDRQEVAVVLEWPVKGEVIR